MPGHAAALQTSAHRGPRPRKVTRVQIADAQLKRAAAAVTCGPGASHQRQEQGAESGQEATSSEGAASQASQGAAAQGFT